MMMQVVQASLKWEFYKKIKELFKNKEHDIKKQNYAF